MSSPGDLTAIRAAVRELCARFDGAYWRSLEPDSYPDEFVRVLTEAGWLAALIPEEFGGGGLGLTAASVVLEEINASGGNAAACHAQMYTMGTLLRHGSDAQKQRYLPAIARGELRLQAFGVTEPTVGLRHDAHPDVRATNRRWLRHPRAEDLDVTRAAFRPDAAARADNTARRRRGEERRALRVPARHAHGR